MPTSPPVATIRTKPRSTTVWRRSLPGSMPCGRSCWAHSGGSGGRVRGRPQSLLLVRGSAIVWVWGTLHPGNHTLSWPERVPSLDGDSGVERALAGFKAYRES
jgi:hypothetical protein